MLTDADINKPMSVLATKQDVAELKEEVISLRESILCFLAKIGVFV